MVALLIPVRNEVEYIDTLLAELAGQTYPRDRLMIAVIDGESTDDTRGRVAKWTERDERIVLIENPERLMPAGLNIGIRSTRSDIVGVIGGHSSVDNDYVERAVAALERTGAWCVGSRVNRIATTPVQRAIARAASSPVGVGDSKHNYATEPGWAETAYPGIWPRWVFERIGLFDPAMVYNEDNELSTRILAAGGRIWFEPSIEVRYVPRASLGGLFHQYRRYALGKAAVFRKHRGALRWRHIVPPAWVAWLPAGALIGFVLPVVWVVLAASIVAYIAVVVAASLRGRVQGDSVILTVAAFVAIHVGYGIGMWQGLLGLARR